MDDEKLSINYSFHIVAKPSPFYMTSLEQKLLDTIQDAFPLEERPYQVLAEQLDSDEQSVFAAVENLRKSGVIRRIGGVYDSRKLGFISRLCAGKVPTVSTGADDDSALEKFVEAVNGIPAITHNYLRSHEYNVWFTVIAESPEAIQKVVDELCAGTELHDVHVLTATKKFKINTVMGGGSAAKPKPAGKQWLVNRKKVQNFTFDDSDRARIRIACEDIPHTLTPFKDWGVSTEGLTKDLSAGLMRRFGAILRHQDAGYPCNAMVCFNLDESRGSASSPTKTSDERGVTRGEQRESMNPAGVILARKPYISHCYERPSFEDFPYTLYAMMHAQTPGELDSYVKECAGELGNPDYVVLHSERELKKTSFKFFA